MILITGGRFQGKEAFARELGRELCGADLYCVSCRELAKAYEETDKQAAFEWFLEQLKSADVVLDLEEAIRMLVKEGGEVNTFAKTLIEEGAPVIITLSELSCGVVPIDPFDVQYRELSGRGGCMLAKEASDVYRMVCGIAQKIK